MVGYPPSKHLCIYTLLLFFSFFLIYNTLNFFFLLILLINFWLYMSMQLTPVFLLVPNDFFIIHKFLYDSVIVDIDCLNQSVHEYHTILH